MGHVRSMNKDLQIRKGGVGVFWQCNLKQGCTVSIYNIFILNDYVTFIKQFYTNFINKSCAKCAVKIQTVNKSLNHKMAWVAKGP